MGRFIVLLSVLAAVATAQTYKIAFIQDTLGNDWRKAQVDQAIVEALKYDFLDLDIRDADAKVAKQIYYIEQCIDRAYDFIITSPIDPKLSSMVLQKALEKDIKVILLSRGVDSDNYTTYIAPNNYQIGKQAARLLLKKMDYKGTVLMLQGIDGATPTRDREDGFEEVASQYEDIKIIKRRGNFLRNDTIKVMEQLYQNKIAFDGIYSHSDSMLEGAREVMQRYGDSLQKPMVGIDYIQSAQKAIKAGVQTASFTYPTASKEGIEAIVDIIRGKEVQKDRVIDSTMVTKDNVDEIEPIF